MSPIPTTYKAYVYEQYGKCTDVLKIAQVTAGPLGTDSVRVKVHYAALNPIDHMLVESRGELLTGGKPSAEKPYKIGFDASGVVAEIGEGVTEFKVGDEVFLCTGISSFGTIAEYVDVETKYVAPKPNNLDFDQAASVPLAAITSYQSVVLRGHLQAGERMLVLGGSSSCGLYAIQFAKSVGAHIAATTSAVKAEMVKSVGADQTIDYHTQKWVDVIEKPSSDLIYDCAMEPASWNTDAQVLLKHGGRFVSLGMTPAPIESPIGATRLNLVCHASGDYLSEVGKLIESGKVKPVVDMVVPFEDLLVGIARVRSGRGVGKVIIKVI
jgi:NADPH:quinone reductase-like Zn-dependent oxidoreductase